MKVDLLEYLEGFKYGMLSALSAVEDYINNIICESISEDDCDEICEDINVDDIEDDIDSPEKYSIDFVTNNKKLAERINKFLNNLKNEMKEDK